MLRTGRVGDVPPYILAGLQDLVAEGFRHVDAGLGRCVAGLGFSFVSFEGERWSGHGGCRKYARSRQRERDG